MEDFFKLIIPDLSGDYPFVCLDILESLDRADSSGLTVPKLSKAVRKPEMLVEKTVKYLNKIGVIEAKGADGGYLLAPGHIALKKFLDIYRTPTGRLKIIEKVLGF